ncbi:hypothetical protein ACU4GI_47760 [Cupriavidus basilensis]
MSDSILISVRNSLRDSGYQLFSNWSSVEPALDAVLSRGDVFLRHEFTRELTAEELAILEECPSAELADAEQSADLAFTAINGGNQYWIDENTVEQMHVGIFTCEVMGSRTYELDPKDSGDCYRYYDVRAIWSVSFKLDDAIGKFSIENIGDSSLSWESGDI